jgi:hypothetical protein
MKGVLSVRLLPGEPFWLGLEDRSHGLKIEVRNGPNKSICHGKFCVDGRQTKEEKACCWRQQALSTFLVIPGIESRASRRQDSHERPHFPFIPTLLSEPDFNIGRPMGRENPFGFPLSTHALSRTIVGQNTGSCQRFFYPGGSAHFPSV